MVTYSEKEMIGITELSRSLNSVVESLATNSIEKMAIFKSNKPKVVMVPFNEYQRMKELADLVEYHEIADIIDERLSDGNFKGGFDFEKYHKERKQGKSNVWVRLSRRFTKWFR